MVVETESQHTIGSSAKHEVVIEDARYHSLSAKHIVLPDHDYTCSSRKLDPPVPSSRHASLSSRPKTESKSSTQPLTSQRFPCNSPDVDRHGGCRGKRKRQYSNCLVTMTSSNFCSAGGSILGPPQTTPSFRHRKPRPVTTCAELTLAWIQMT